MKYSNVVITVLYMIMIGLSSCTNPTMDVVEEKTVAYVPEVEEVIVPVPEIKEAVQVVHIEEVIEYQYTIIGTWRRDFDQHTEYYVFKEDTLTTYCDGVQNGYYQLEYLEDWTFMLCETVFDYELLHGEDDYLILNDYQYKKQ